jgi:serine/threonine protein kinase
LEYPEGISKNATSFIDNLIKKDPKDRMSSDQILEHPFLKNVASRFELKKSF